MDAEGVGRFADRAFDPGRLEPRPWLGLASAGDRPAERGQRDDRVAGAVQRRPDELGHPGVDDDLAAAALADVEDAGHEPARPRDERPTRLDRQPGRAAVLGHGGEQRRDLAREPLRRPGAGSPSGRTGNPPPTSSVSNAGRSAAEQADDRQAAADGVPPRVDRAELRADVEVDRRAAGPPHAALDRATRPAPVASVSVIPNLDAPGPDGQHRRSSRARRPG